MRTIRKICVWLNFCLLILLLLNGCSQEHKEVYKVYQGKGDYWSAKFLIFDRIHNSEYTDGILKITYIGDISDDSINTVHWSYLILHKDSKIEDDEVVYEGAFNEKPLVTAKTGGGGIIAPPEKSYLNKEIVSPRQNLNYDFIKNSKNEMYINIEWNSNIERIVMKRI